MSHLLDLLGHKPTDRVVIIVCQGLGSSNAANHGVLTAMRDGLATSAAIHVPCPWSRAAAAEHRGEDVGVSLTFISEHTTYRWGPVTRAPSLLDGNGGFPTSNLDLGEHADTEEVIREARAQLERAVLWGFDPTHLSTHLDALCHRPELFDAYLELAVEFNLPVSLPDPKVDLGFPARELAAAEGLLTPDRVVSAPLGTEARSYFDEAISELEPGVTELRLRPAIDTPELRAITPRWAAQVSDAHLVTNDWAFRAALDRSGAIPVGFRQLRTAQRAIRP